MAPTTDDRQQTDDGHKKRPDSPLEEGTTVRDRRDGRAGTILDSACQYSHPKAAPVYNYLVRWDDGQVQAFNEHALRRGGIVEVEEPPGDDSDE